MAAAAGILLCGALHAHPQVELPTLFPEGTHVYADGSGLAPLFEQGLEHTFVSQLLSSEVAKLLLANVKATPREALAFLGQVLGAPVLPTLSTLIDRGLALGLELGQDDPKLTLVARTSDDLLLERMFERVLFLAMSNGGGPGLGAPAEQWRGVDVWRIRNELAVAVLDGHLLASNDDATFRNVLGRLLGDPASTSLADAKRWSPGTPHRDELAWAWLDLDAIAEHTDVTKVRELVALPQVHMLLGTDFALLGQAQALTAALLLTDLGLGLRLSGAGIESGACAPLLTGARSAAPPPLPPPHPDDVARLLAYRDFGAIFHERAALFPPALLPEFTRTSTELAPLLGGMDLGDDLLPGLSPWLRVVVRGVSFRAGLQPEIALPAAALLVELKDAERLGPKLVSSFQTAVGATNLERAQQGLSPMLLELAIIAGQQVTSARLLPPEEGDGVDMAYNLEPACAVFGDTFLIASHVGLIDELLRDLQRAEPGSTPGSGDRLVLHGPRVAEHLQKNFEALVMNGVLKEGKELAVARKETTGLIAALRLIEHVTLTTARPSSDGVTVELRLELIEGER